MSLERLRLELIALATTAAQDRWGPAEPQDRNRRVMEQHAPSLLALPRYRGEDGPARLIADLDTTIRSIGRDEGGGELRFAAQMLFRVGITDDVPERLKSVRSMDALNDALVETREGQVDGKSGPGRKWMRRAVAMRIVDGLLALDETDYVEGPRPRAQARQVAYGSVAHHHHEAFLVDAGGRLWHQWWPRSADNLQWSGWYEMERPEHPTVRERSGRRPTGENLQLTGVATANTKWSLLHLAAAGSDGLVHIRSYRFDQLVDQGVWEEWEALPQGGRAVTGPIAMTSREPGHLEIMAIDSTGERVNRWGHFNGDTLEWHWGDWYDLPDPLA